MGIEIPRFIYKGYMITLDILSGKFGLPGVPNAKTTFNSAEEASGFIELKIAMGEIANREGGVNGEN